MVHHVAPCKPVLAFIFIPDSLPFNRVKRVMAILLIAIHLINIIGCYGIFAILQKTHEEKFSNALNADEFVGSDAITLRVPLTMPYTTANANYERIEGKFEYEGEVYQLVKQKLHNDTLYVVCVKDNRSTKIKDAFKDFANSLTDHQTNQKNQRQLVNLLIKDFEPVSVLSLKSSTFLMDLIACPSYMFSEQLNNGFPVDQPPKV